MEGVREVGARGGIIQRGGRIGRIQLIPIARRDRLHIHVRRLNSSYCR